MLLDDIEKVLRNHLMDCGCYVQILHPVELVPLLIGNAKIPVLLRITVAELIADVCDVVSSVVVPDTHHELKHIVVDNTTAELLERALYRKVRPIYCLACQH